VPFSLWALAPRVTRAQLAGFAVMQAVCWIAVHAFVASVTGAPPNPKSSMPGGVEWYLWTNLRTLTYPLYAATVLVPFAGGAWLPLLAWWGERPPLARALLVWYVLPAAATAFVFGIFTRPACSPKRRPRHGWRRRPRRTHTAWAAAPAEPRLR
jgi:hypothetical protein